VLRCELGHTSNSCFNNSECEITDKNAICCQDENACNRCISKYYLNLLFLNCFTIIFYSIILERCPTNPYVPTGCLPSEIEVVNSTTGCIYLRCAIFNLLNTENKLPMSTTDLNAIENTNTFQPTAMPMYPSFFFTFFRF
jgi:hypothetical protein